jgi:hypothetical protein
MRDAMEIGSRRTRASGKHARVLALALAAAALAGVVGPARALTLDDITPLYFDGPGGYGFDGAAAAAAGRSAGFSATPFDRRITAPGSAVTIAQQLSTVHQAPASPTDATPTIVDSIWTITNVAAGDLYAPMLVFTSLDPLNTYSSGTKPRQGLDADLLALLAYSSGGTNYLFGAVALPDLAEGDSAEFTLRYVVATPLLSGSTGQLLAPLGVSLLASHTTIPEPSTFCLLAFGLLGASTTTSNRGFRRRRTSHRSGGGGASSSR